MAGPKKSRTERAADRLVVQGPLEVLYDPRGPVTVDPEVRETTDAEYAAFRAQQKRRAK